MAERYNCESEEDLIHRKLHEWGCDPEPPGIFPDDPFLDIPTGTLVEEDEKIVLAECEKFSRHMGVYSENRKKRKMD